jgi:hypothetical protein
MGVSGRKFFPFYPEGEYSTSTLKMEDVQGRANQCTVLYIVLYCTVLYNVLAMSSTLLSFAYAQVILNSMQHYQPRLYVT